MSSPDVIVSPTPGRRRGFTLIEVMVVLAIIATLSAIAIPSYWGYLEKEKVREVIFDIKILESDIEQYVAMNGKLPATLDDLKTGPHLDRWGNPFKYLPVAGASVGKLRKDRNLHPVNSDYDLYSMGADGKTATPFTAKVSQDDIVRANDGNFVGLVSDY